MAAWLPEVRGTIVSIDIPMKREGQHLVPVDQVAADMLAEVPLNTGVMVTVKVPRNLRQFRLAWALADIISKSVDFLSDREAAMDWLKIKSRHVRMIHDPLRGTTAIVPKSIAFASLDQVGFARLLNRMIYVTTTEIIPGLEAGALRAELESIVGIDTEPVHASDPLKPPKAAKSRKSPAEVPHASANDTPKEVQDAAGAGQDLEPVNPPPNRPTNEAEYVSACRSWLTKQTDRHASFDYFNGETHRKMRLDLKISTSVRKSLEREMGEFFDAKDRSKTAAKA
jgi:hypothetical protein